MLPFTRKYLIHGLSGTPDILARLFADVRPGDPRWDARPEPDRWTLREITAHLADWEGIFGERVRLMLETEEPEFGYVDVTQLGIEHGYERSDPALNLVVFRDRRTALLDVLGQLEDEQWSRVCRRHIGVMSLEEMVALILGHDGYHTHQAVQWLEG